MEQAKVEAEQLRMETEKQKEKSDEYYAQIKAERDKAVQQARKEAQYIIEDARRTANNVYEELKQLRKQAKDGAFVEGSNEKQAALRRSLNEAEGKLREKQEVRLSLIHISKSKLDAIICSTIPRGAVKTAEMSDRSNPQT